MKKPFSNKPLLPQWLGVIAAAVALQSAHSLLADETYMQAPMHVMVSQSQVIKVSEPIAKLDVADPKIATAKLLSPFQVLVTGVAPGATDVIVWNDKGQFQQQEVDVSINLTAMQDDLNQMFPHDTISIKGIGNVVVISGQLSNATEIDPLHNYFKTQKIDYVDNTSIAGVQQVQLKVILAEANRTAIRALGINAFQTNTDFFSATSAAPSNSTSLPINIGAPAGASATSAVPFNFLSAAGASPTTTLLFGVPPANLEFFIQALVENEYVRILAEPTLVAESGQEASFLAGGEFPIPVVQGAGASTSGTSITITYEQYGVSLNFRPIVLGDGRIQLHLAPTVSDLSSVGALEISGFNIPAIVTRQAETTLELHNGQSFAIAGLIDRETQADSSEVPGLGALPVLGALFRSVRYEDDDTELVVIVTANLVEPSNAAERPPLPGDLHVTPTDWELFADGKIDGEAPPQLAPADAAMFKDEGLDQLHGPGAWATYDAPPGPSQSEMDQGNSQAATASAPATQ